MQMLNIMLLVAAFLFLTACSVDISEPKYTQDVEVFKKDNQRGRMELLLGCWLMSREYNSSASESRQLALIKACMRTITRKDSVVKITSLIGKNMSVPKSYSEVVPEEGIPGGEDWGERSEFDEMLLSYVRGYAKDIQGIQQGKEGEELKKRVGEIETRQKYYFGVIPVNQFTHTLMLVVVSILMVAVCTCWKYYSRKGEKKQEQTGYFKHQNHSPQSKEGSFTKSPKPKRS